jgi:hypothetical protein
MIRRNAALAAAVAATALAGCGGSSNKQLSYSDFISKANKVCADGNAEVANVSDAKKAGQILDKYVQKFKDLEPPDKLKPAYDEFVAVSQQQVEKLNAGDFEAANALGPKSNEIAAKMGTRQCISG